MNPLRKNWLFFLSTIALIGLIIDTYKIPKKRLHSLRESGTLTVATRMNGVGCYYHRDQPAGLECDLLQAFAEHLNVAITFKTTASINETLTLLTTGEADIAASDLTHTPNRAQQVTFSRALFETREVLVQRKKNALTRFAGLKGKTLTIHTDSTYREEIEAKAASQKIPLISPGSGKNQSAITIAPAKEKISILELIDAVSLGEIDFTIADEHIVKGGNGYNKNLDTSLVFGEQRRIAFALSKDGDDSLVNSLNRWLASEEAQAIIHLFLARLTEQRADRPQNNAPPKDTLSPWDKLFKRYASEPFDWVWLAAQTSAESSFRPDAVSHAGAQGLMQLMPETAREVGVTDSFNPAQNIQGGVKYNSKQYQRWKHLPQRTAIAFTFASYNAGAGHVLDARRLALQDGSNPDQWFSTNSRKGVEDYIVLLRKAEFYNNPVVKYGYCRGSETRQYVRKIFQQEASYRLLLKATQANGEAIRADSATASITPYRF
ncbi:transglycosylase SLT domain-containing protein [Microbulbifer sp. SSSA002]|uniref:transglycosylase SLT domain-containing protein n=1 Tax=unclassified Microbulbifer TaxID=2619833 RepID=UPI0040391ED1